MYLGDKLSLWPLNMLVKEKRLSKIAIVEGVFGALRARSFGIPAFATLGAMVKADVKLHINSFYPVAMFDNDYAGMLGAARLLIMIPTTKVVIPGVEADELDKFEWETLWKEGLSTRSISTLARLSKRPEEFTRSIKSFMRKQKGDENDWKRRKREDEERPFWP